MKMYDGDGRENPENEKKKETKEKDFPRLVVYEKWRPTVFRCPKTSKTSRTYPRWDWGPSLVGKEIQGWARNGTIKEGR